MISERLTPAVASLIIFIFFTPFYLAQPDETKKQASTLGQDVNTAIKKGIAFIRTQQKEDGYFKPPDDVYADGYAALCMLAFLKSGVPSSDPAVQKALEFIQCCPYTKTYSTAVRIMALEALHDKKVTGQILSGAKWLLENFRDVEGEWAYPDNSVDLSNTQYAVLGLWTAERFGFKSPKEIWKRLASTVIKKHQTQSGGFTYNQNSEEAKGSMTCAGLFILPLCQEKLKKDPEIIEAIDSGWKFLERRYIASGNPLGEQIYTKDHFYYYLYSLERCCAIAGKQKITQKDWYREGAAELVKLQDDNGSWKNNIKETSFALLFLKRSTYTTINKKHGTNLEGAGGKKDENKIRPSNEIPFAKNWLFLGPFDNTNEAPFLNDLIQESEVDPKEGKRYKKLKWKRHRSLGNIVSLKETVADENKVLAYAFSRVRVENDTEALIWIGSGDGARIFLDGKLVFNYPFRCNDGPDAHSAPITLTRGDHRLLVKVMHHIYEWRLALRISKPDGKPLTDLITFTEPSGPTMLELFESSSPYLSPWEIFRLLPLDRKTVLDFSNASDLDRFYIEHNTHEKPLETLSSKKDGRRSRRDANKAVAFKIRNREAPLTLFRKIKVPSKRYILTARLSVQTPKNKAETDWIARLGVYDGSDGESGSIRWFDKEMFTSKKEAYPMRSKQINAKLEYYAGKEVLILLECSEGGKAPDGGRESGCIHEFSIRPN